MIDPILITVNPPPVVEVTVEPPPVIEVTVAAGAPVPGPPGQSQTYDVIGVSTWSQAHGLKYDPMVRLVRDGELVLIGAEYPDSAHVYIEFPVPFTGTIILS